MGRVTLLISAVLLALVAGFQAMDRDRAVAQKAVAPWYQLLIDPVTS